ncbi:NEDD8 ultimate buster 1 [Anopheles nili]|uniref:NEDD8 ultimate buster 1 n=1 Tax=Anopheles nili TaxID=185578 RepID=UPI00237B8D04|nr:NEDD8 ultimate buster 1 [Anopheles nili]
MAELERENHLIQLRALLNERHIKLWQTPFLTAERLTNMAEIRTMAESLGTELAIPIDLCEKALIALQRNALDKLESKDEFQKTGIATLKVRAPTQSAVDRREFNLKIKTTETGWALSEKIAQQLMLDARKIKMVCTGKIINGDRTLLEQNIGNGAVVLALVMAIDEKEAKSESLMYGRVQKIRADAELILSRNERWNFLSLEDQSGNAIFLPKDEKKALLMGLTLYEKGKVAMKAGRHEEALLLMLEADHDLCACNSELLNVVDNYALLNMDIVWCYLLLQNINQLPDAEVRLQVCEKRLQQSYSANMQRVAALRGEESYEKALFVRLHLLKAVLFFHQNKRDDARTMFQVVESELTKLRIDDATLSRLMECGYSMTESRIALRVSANDMEAAIEHILNRRQTLQNNAKRKSREIKLYETIGHNVVEEGGMRLDLDQVDILMEMGYPEELAAMAMKHSKNDINEALNQLQSNGESLQNKLLHAVRVDKELLRQLVELGYSSEVASVSLKINANNLREAIYYLELHVTNGVLSPSLQRTVEEVACKQNAKKRASSAKHTRTADAQPSSSKQSSKNSPEKLSTEMDGKQQEEMLDLLFQSFSKDLKADADSHWDVTLVDEEVLLKQYKLLLGMD